MLLLCKLIIVTRLETIKTFYLTEIKGLWSKIKFKITVKEKSKQEQDQSINNRISFLKYLISTTFLLKLFFLYLLIGVLQSLGAGFLMYDYMTSTRCAVQWFNTTTSIMVVMPLFISIIILFFFIITIKKPYKIKLELFLNVIIFIAWLMMLIISLFSFWRQYVEGSYFPSNMFLVFYLILSNFVNVFLPILYTFDFFYFFRKKKDF